MFVGLSVCAVSRSVATSRSDLCTLGGGVSGEQMFSCVLGRQGMDLGVGVVFVLKFSGISALGRALLTHEQ